MRKPTGVIGGLTFLTIGVLLVAGFDPIGRYRMARRVRQLEEDKSALLDLAARMTSSRRVAQVNVLSRSLDPAGRPVHLLRWQEIAADGCWKVPRSITVTGTLAYFEAAVLKFNSDRLKAGNDDAVSVAVFRRAFGDLEYPFLGPVLDERAEPLNAPGDRSVTQVDGTGRHRPDKSTTLTVDSDAGRRALPATPPRGAIVARSQPSGPEHLPVQRPSHLKSGDDASTHERLWSLFWSFVDDPKLAQTYGVRVAQLEAPALPLTVGEVWEVTLDAIGGVNLRKLRSVSPAGDDSPSWVPSTRF